jgi:hypothetical protein
MWLPGNPLVTAVGAMDVACLMGTAVVLRCALVPDSTRGDSVIIDVIAREDDACDHGVGNRCAHRGAPRMPTVRTVFVGSVYLRAWRKSSHDCFSTEDGP